MPAHLQTINDNFIHYASIECFDETKLLLSIGANVHYKDNYALKVCANHGFVTMVKLLVENDANIHVFYDYPLRQSVANNHESVVEYLLEKKANVTVMDNIALRTAALNGNVVIARMLLNAGADVHNSDVLKNAIQNNNIGIIELLLEYGMTIPHDYKNIKNGDIRKLFENKIMDNLVKNNKSLMDENSLLKKKLDDIILILDAKC